MGEHDTRLHDQSTPSSYDDDWAAWISQQIALLRSRRYDELDHDNLLDEVESLARSDFRAWVSAFRLVLLHMLKWDYQPAFRTRSWQSTINIQRARIVNDLEDCPSYRRRVAEAIRQAYRQARAQAADETDLIVRTFPETCPYDWDMITNREHPLPGENG